MKNINIQSQSGEKYEIEEIRNQILQGDCIEQLKKIPDNSIDLILADPPYYMQTEGDLFRTDGTKFAGIDDEWDKFDGYQDYDSFSEAWLRECKRILTKDGSIWVIGAFQNIFRIGYIMQNLGFWILNDVIWSKPNAVPNFSGTRFQNSHETMLWCTKSKKSKYTFNYKTMKHLNNEKQEKSVWDIGICIGSERIKGSDGKKAHATQKPEKLLYKVILSTSKPGDLVLDPFFGTGTTGSVAKYLGRDFIGIDNSAEYIKIAQKRIASTETLKSDLHDLSLEVKPPKVSMENLIASGYLKVNQGLFNKKGLEICKVLSNGHVNDGEDTLSIHRMSAKHLGQINHNGWDYFYVMKNKNLVPINDLRYEYSGAQNA